MGRAAKSKRLLTRNAGALEQPGHVVFVSATIIWAISENVTHPRRCYRRSMVPFGRIGPTGFGDRAAPCALVLIACLTVSLIGANESAAGAGQAADEAKGGISTKRSGTLLASSRLQRKLWIPSQTRKAFALKYVTTNAFGRNAASTGTVFIPKGSPPRGGWPVISWAHGTSGLGDRCAPSKAGPVLPERDWPYLARWMKEGYAIVASDYVGLGTRGLMAYLHGASTAHSVVDIVNAGQRFSRRKLGRKQRLSSRWVTIGQSQGAGGAIFTARFATDFGGRRLHYLGAVGTGTPANVERVMTLLGPGIPTAAVLPRLTVPVSYIFTSLRYVHPELGIDEILTAAGRKYLKLAETKCPFSLEKKLAGVDVGDFFTRPVMTLPGFAETVRAYMGMPEDGFDRPFFMGHGLRDLEVPYATTAAYVAALVVNGEPVTFRTYANDHSGTLVESQRDTIPFVRGLFAKE